ncbi:helix-turn-helix domain-containing protein [Neobacillus mesonae]|uniref:helix-turn-helix domain-containing protein n=1 Tax=Neobacillus mesonae TaxID=1193713 RepID=UPI00203D24F9|nr:helix-turn-helix domain-containing protein [Neobacillus mesonae]MCM3568546.1 helix-turn-helix domain-containing protein [Neobacillus mesonae]
MDNSENFQLNLQNIEFLSSRIYPGIEILLVLDGEIIVETDSGIYQMKENDLLVINRNQVVQVRAVKHNTVFSLRIPDAFISKYYEEYRHYQFHLFSGQIDRGKENILAQLRKSLAELLVTYCRHENEGQLEIHILICKILLTLILRFKGERSHIEEENVKDQRLKEIISHIKQHFDEPITLEEVAAHFYLSPSYFSRYFKQQLGIGFSRFLMNIRLEHSVKDLLYTKDSITFISMKNGFPNAKSFTNLFKEVYGETPHSFREKNAQEEMSLVNNFQLEDSGTLLNSPEIIMKLGVLVSEGDHTSSLSNTETHSEELKIDLSSTNRKVCIHPNNILMIGELRELQKENVRTQVLLAKKGVQIKYIGIHKLLSGRTIPTAVETDELIPTTSPYYNSDEVIQFIKTNDLSLFIQIGYKGIASDEKAYFQKLEHFLRHCLQVFGETYVSSWYFMYVTNDETIDSKKIQDFYLTLYKLLKTIVPSIQVGLLVPFSFQTGTTDDKHKWILHQQEQFDFIAYQASSNEIVDFTDIINDNYLLAKDFIKKKTEKLKRYLKSHSIEKPLHLITWSSFSGNTRYTNGVFFRGALILNDAMSVAEDVQSLGFWINTEIHERTVGAKNIPLEGMELFHYFSGKRPAYYAMSFLNRLQGKVITKGANHIMVENASGYQIVLMNNHIVNPYFSIEETFLQKLMKEVRVTIKGIPEGEYQIRKYVFDKDHGALYKNWWENNSKFGLDTEIVDYITQSSQPSLEVFDEKIDGEWSFYSYLTINAIHFFDIRKVFV